MLVDKLVNQTTEYILRPDERNKISKAIELAYQAHDGRYRLNGSPYVDHVLSVANILAAWNAPADIIVISLLHDTQDKNTSILYKSNVVFETFGMEVVKHIRSVNLLGRFGEAFPSALDISKINDFEQLSNNYPWVYRLFCQTPQSVIVKLADRLDSFTTVDSLKDEDKQRIALTTLNIFVPLADQLGIHSLKRTLQDDAYKIIDPESYEHSKHSLEESFNLFRNSGILEELFNQLSVSNKDITVTAFPTSVFSFKKNVELRKKDPKQFNLPVLILTKYQHSSHSVLAKLQEIYPESEFGFKDYYAMPKTNGYRAIHTRLQIKNHMDHIVFIRDDLSHKVAEMGIIAGWMGIPENLLPQIPKLPPVPIGNITVFTPKKDMRHLPQDSTPLDFASAIHPELIYHCLGAKVNGELTELDFPLEDGVVVEILRSENPIVPNPSWLNSVKTKKASQLIKKMLSSEIQTDEARNGLRKVEIIFRKSNNSIATKQILNKLDKVAIRLGYPSTLDLLLSIDAGKENPENIALRIDEAIVNREEYNTPRAVLDSLIDLPVVIPKCCTPHPPDQIVGYRKKDGKATIHRSDCKKIINLKPLLSAHWETFDSQIESQIEVLATNRVGLVNDISNVISNQAINIISFHADEITDGSARVLIVLGRVYSNQLQNLLRSIKGIKNVKKVLNTRPGIPASFAEGAVIARLIAPSYSLNPATGFDFFGRNEEIKNLSWSITNLKSGNAVLLWGRRRIGKTSLLKEFQRRALDHSDFVSVYLNLAQFSGMNHTRMLYEIVNSISEKAGNPNIAPPKYQRLAKDPLGYFDGFFNQFRIRDNRPIILILDELETMFTFQGNTENQPFYQYFREVIQNREGLSFILSFGDVIDEFYKYPGVSSFLNIIRTQRLGTLLRADAKDLVVNPLRGLIHYEDQVVEEILRLTNCHPYFIKLLCGDMLKEFSTYDGELNFSRFNSFLEDWIPTIGEHYFSHIWGAESQIPINEQITYRQLLITSAHLASRNSWIDYKKILASFSRLFGIEHSKTQTMLFGLRSLEAIEFGGDLSVYRIKMPLLEKWLKEKYPKPHQLKGIK